MKISLLINMKMPTNNLTETIFYIEYLNLMALSLNCSSSNLSNCSFSATVKCFFQSPTSPESTRANDNFEVGNGLTRGIQQLELQTYKVYKMYESYTDIVNKLYKNCFVYCIYPKYLDIFTISALNFDNKTLKSPVLIPVDASKNCWKKSGSVDPDQTPRSTVSDLGLYCLLRPVCLNTSDMADANG